MTGYKSPPRRRTPKIHLTPRNAISKRLLERYAVLLTWSAVGAEIGISGGMAYRVAVQAYEPHRASIRAALGLPAMIPTAPCQACSVVHVAKRCPAARKPGKPRRDWRGSFAWLAALWASGALEI